MYNAESISPIPVLKIIRADIGIIRQKKLHLNTIPSSMQNRIKTKNVRLKFISEETILESRKRYLGTFIFEKTSAFESRALIAPPVASLKNENMMFPQKT